MKTITTLIMLGAVALVSGCGAPEVSGPEAALRDFYKHLNDGDYTEAMSMYSAEAREVIDDPDAFGDGGFDGWARSATREGSVSRVNVLSSTPDADSDPATKTTLEFEVVFDDGTSQQGRVRLTEENGQWKLGLLG